jgi:hypothetical protein
MLASECGHVAVLGLVGSNQVLEHKDSHESIDFCSGRGHVDVLDWWADLGPVVEYPVDAMDLAMRHEQVTVLGWEVQSGLQLKYSARTIDAAIRECRVGVLDRWITTISWKGQLRRMNQALGQVRAETRARAA